MAQRAASQSRWLSPACQQGRPWVAPLPTGSRAKACGASVVALRRWPTTPGPASLPSRLGTAAGAQQVVSQLTQLRRYAAGAPGEVAAIVGPKRRLSSHGPPDRPVAVCLRGSGRGLRDVGVHDQDADLQGSKIGAQSGNAQLYADLVKRR